MKLRGDSHPVDDLLRVVAGEPIPDDAAVHTGRTMLRSAMVAEERRPVAPPRRLRRPGYALATAAVVVAVVATAGLVWRTAPVTALDQLATAAETAPVPAPEDGRYLYTRTSEMSLSLVPGDEVDLPGVDTVPYLLPTVRERWQGSDGVRETLTVETPTFFDPAHETAYLASDLHDADGVGTTTTEDFTETDDPLDARDWPEQPAPLLDAIGAYASNQLTGVPEPVAAVEVAAELLRSPRAEPALRAAAIGALDRLDAGVVQLRPGGSVVFAVDYREGDTLWRRRVEFDADSTFRRYAVVMVDGEPALGIPPGTVVSDEEMLDQHLVSEIGERNPSS